MKGEWKNMGKKDGALKNDNVSIHQGGGKEPLKSPYSSSSSCYTTK